MLPFGSNWVTTAAMLVVRLSAAESCPAVAGRGRVGGQQPPGQHLRAVPVSRPEPRKLVMPESSLVERLRWVSLAKLAWSVM